jgi:tRNA G18 (ribose-2'-O)-methylase SpoU
MKLRKLLNIELERISAEEYKDSPDIGMIVILDNIRSAHNVGSAFRTCDSFKADKLWLCGICATPPSAEIRKTALGAEESVPWEYSGSTLDVVNKLKSDGYTVVSVEQTVNSVSLENFNPSASSGTGKYALIFGNEVDGVSQEVVDASDFSLEIPQFGTKHSLNVSVAIGVVLWQFTLGRLSPQAIGETPHSGNG